MRRSRSVERFPTRAAARLKVAAWIEEYNHDRRHSALGMQSPVQFDLDLGRQQREAA